jgi:hypothetical protein
VTKLSIKPPEQNRSVSLAAPAGAERAPTAEIAHRQDWSGFLLTAVEFGLLALVICFFEIESQRFGRLVAWAWGGFLINHFLRERLRLPFFVAVSLWCLYVVAGGTVAVCVLLGGMAILGICHLPIPFALRVAVIVVAGAFVACLRVGGFTDRINVAAWVILGSMFMFRIIVYLYDLKHRNGEFSLFRGMAYFFMLPNVCFPFFPLVDYQTFCSSHFSDVPVRIYQVGVRWIFRGVVHLLLYRVIHQLVMVSPMDVTDLGGVVRFMVATFLLYLKVSGQFHIIVGLLHMFGFHLAETHHLYFLSTSFTDLWRRMNIYWKDFLTKIFFYPVFFRLKRFGTTTAMVSSTLLVFVATWFLHGYQYFWIRGSFEYSWQNVPVNENVGRLGKSFVKALNFTWQDSLFWSILAVIVVANVLYEGKKGRRRALTKPRRTFRSEVRLALGSIGTFVIMCTLWTLWYSKSYDELEWLAGAATHVSVRDVALILSGLAALGVLSVLWDRFRTSSTHKSGELYMSRSSFWKSVGLVGVPCCLLLLIGYQDLPAAFEATAAGDILTAIKIDQQLNPEEVEELHRGYYEELDVARRDEKLKFLRDAAPRDWYSTEAFQHDTGYFQVKELMPGYKDENYHGKRLTVNRWGMRDRDTYQKQKPPGVYRIALLGSSHEFGSGVADDEVFDNLVEDRLNAEAGHASQRYEILNFAQPSASTFSYLIQLERKAMAFGPDAVFVFVNEREFKLTGGHLISVFKTRCEVPYEIINKVFHNAGLEEGMSPDLMYAKLKPFTNEIMTFAYGQFADFSRRTGIPVYIVYRPPVISWSLRSSQEAEKNKRGLILHAREAHLQLIDLSNAFDGVKNWRSLMVTQFDDHMNAEAHRLLADCLFRNLHDGQGKLIFEATKP